MRQESTVVILSKRRRPDAVQHRLSVRGGYSIALRRNVRHCGSEALSMTLEAGVGRKSMNKWEIVLAASVTLQSRHWYHSWYEYLERSLTQRLSASARAARLSAAVLSISTPGGPNSLVENRHLVPHNKRSLSICKMDL